MFDTVCCVAHSWADVCFNEQRLPRVYSVDNIYIVIFSILNSFIFRSFRSLSSPEKLYFFDFVVAVCCCRCCCYRFNFGVLLPFIVIYGHSVAALTMTQSVVLYWKTDTLSQSSIQTDWASLLHMLLLLQSSSVLFRLTIVSRSLTFGRQVIC